jgi:hypothetical protein
MTSRINGSDTPNKVLLVDNLDEAQRSLSTELTRLLLPPTTRDAEQEPTPLGFADLQAALQLVTKLVGVGDRLESTEIRVRSVPISTRRPDKIDDDFLNSYILDDLGRVAGQVRAGRCGPALRAYLSGDRPTDPVDLREHPEVSFEAVRPAATPLGRWPSNRKHPLALSQQFAVNQILAETTASRIFAVNGPPGTGKTTLLRDLVAAIVVRRAEALASLTHPADAFTHLHEVAIGDKRIKVRAWRPDLVGHEIVVASSNNGAVENVSLEMPLLQAIAKDQYPDVDYFADVATSLLIAARNNEGDTDEPESPEAPTTTSPDPTTAWALIAAKLGSKANRQAFATSTWFNKSEDEIGRDGRPSVRSHLKAMRDTAPEEPWTQCVARFRACLARAERERADRMAVYEAWTALVRARSARAGAQRAARAATDRRYAIQERTAAIDLRLQQTEGWLRTRREARAAHRAFRPGLLRSLFDRRSAQAWQIEDDRHAHIIRDAENAQHHMWHERSRLAEELRRAADSESAALGHLAAVDQAGNRAEQILAVARGSWGDAIPDVDTWSSDIDRRERSAPWSDEPWNTSRTEVFLAALQLHRDFLAHQAHVMLSNYSAAIDVLNGSVPRNVPEEVATAAWQSLFFVVPVITTTFASVGRMFPHLTAEALGWLFIDEAGQATPQNIVGALWRSQRAVVVGDPLQLEPIITLPLPAQQSLRLQGGVAERWLPMGQSVQTIADNLMSVGTHLPTGDGGRRWVGAPLRVHRRCDDPMFTVVNRIAYDGMMISAVERPDDARSPDGEPLIPTCWCHITTTTSDRHWVPAEGERLEQLLTDLAEHGHDMSEVMVIGPFRDVRDGIEPIFRRFEGVRGGTVHTAQGKEADVVILVLGSDPRAEGARQWAARKPNLLNVAVSRARRRLYVIGDRVAWQRQPHFMELSTELP